MTETEKSRHARIIRLVIMSLSLIYHQAIVISGGFLSLLSLPN